MRIPILFSACLVCVLFCLLSAAHANGNINKPVPSGNEAAFAWVIDDLPLMPGFRIVDDKDVLFVTREGRIAQTTVQGGADVDDVYHFYQDSLPQLGWTKIDGRTFERGTERLYIEASGVNPKAQTIVRFSVHPIKGQK